MEADFSAGAPLSKVRLTIISFVSLTFIGYFNIGLSLAVLPVFIHQQLGYSAMIAGMVISLQYVTTFMLRGYAGKIVDRQGPKPAVVLGMTGFAISGVLLLATYLLRDMPALALGILVLMRLATGFSEGLIGASPINWAILAVGSRFTAKAISFNGIASYGALAIGAPLGVILSNSLGLGSISVLIMMLGIIGFFYAKSKPAIGGSTTAPRQSFLHVLKKVSPYGICLALGGLGFGTISTFITLYYNYLNWAGAVLCLSAFGLLFIVGRLIFANAIDNYGGMKTAIVCLAFETVGLLIIWLAHTPYMALMGAGITGLGFSLVFPALGVEAVKLVPPANHGAALGNYGLFIDISLGITGPLVGAVATHFGMRYIFPFSVGVVFVGLMLAIIIYYRTRNNIGPSAAGLTA